MNEITWGIIGCGDVCEVKSGPAFSSIEGSALKLVMRRDGVKAADYARRHSVERWCTDAAEVIDDPTIRAVYIATPPGSHKEYAIRALRAGKAVYVEKPMALSYAECQEMVRVALETGSPLYVAHYRRALPYFIKVKELVQEGAVGEVLSVSIRYLRAASPSDRDGGSWRLDRAVAGGGYLFDLAPHTIDIVEYIVGQIAEVQGSHANRAGLYSVEDTVAASFRFASGALGTALWCFVAAPDAAEDVVEIVGTSGKLTFSTFAFTPIELNSGGNLQQYSFSPPKHIQEPFIRTIVAELRGEGVCLCHGEEGARPSWFMDRVLGRL